MIGAVLFIGFGEAIAKPGPAGALIAYIIFVGTIIYSVMMSLGEMATYIPISGPFTACVTRFIDPSLGFAIRWIYWFSSGFWTDSYALFATNVILPSLAYIYRPYATNNQPELIVNCMTLTGSACSQALFRYLADRYGRRKLYGVELVIVIFGTLCMAQVSTGTNKSMSILYANKINLVTLAGSIIGQLVFGFLADLFGRRKLYGTELIFVIFGTLGLAGSATGFGNSMDIIGWLIYYRFFVGIGIGAGCPLSAVITTE
jgi:MFS family permease